VRGWEDDDSFSSAPHLRQRTAAAGLPFIPRHETPTSSALVMFLKQAVLCSAPAGPSARRASCASGPHLWTLAGRLCPSVGPWPPLHQVREASQRLPDNPCSTCPVPLCRVQSLICSSNYTVQHLWRRQRVRLLVPLLCAELSRRSASASARQAQSCWSRLLSWQGELLE